MITSIDLQSDSAFKNYLNTLSPCALHEHARESLFPEMIIPIILNNSTLKASCLDYLVLHNTVFPSQKEEGLQNYLTSQSEDFLRELLSQLFSKKLLIETLIACTDQYAREDIYRNQSTWDEQNQGHFS